MNSGRDDILSGAPVSSFIRLNKKEVTYEGNTKEKILIFPTNYVNI